MVGLVFAADARRPWLAERTVRSLRLAGAESIEVVPAGASLPLGQGDCLLLRAGSWLRKGDFWSAPPLSATFQSLVALGQSFSGEAADAWKLARQKCGGDFSLLSEFPPLVSVWLDANASKSLAAFPLKAEELWQAFRLDARINDDRALRVVPWKLLDVEEDPHLRTLQVITSLQQGGAEKVAWDLHDLLPEYGVSSGLVTLGNPLRRELPAPAKNWVDLAGMGREERELWMKRLAAQFGADLVHGHLLDGEDIRRVSHTGLPVAITVHNLRPGWPDGLEKIRRSEVSLLIACAQAVEQDLLAAKTECTVRTVWNGIDQKPCRTLAEKASIKDSGTLTLVCIANPRRQKRLHLLPSILVAVEAELAQRGMSVACRLWVVGEVSPCSAEAVECFEQTQVESKRLAVEDRLKWMAGATAVADALAAADVLVSPSLYEGLSLAHLEALLSGVPVVATAVGGTPELAWRNTAMTLVPVESEANDFAKAIVDAWTLPRDSGSVSRAADFSREEMCRRHAWLYENLWGPKKGEVIWFVTNNLSTGGAQSSLRRLVKDWTAQGRHVHVALLQEYAEYPTPGRVDLLRAGIPVTVLPPAGTTSEMEAVRQLLGEMRASPPRAVVLWNGIPAYKILLADALWQVPVFDVSPGEMYFASLQRYFTHPLAGLPYRTPQQYGARLAGVIVKYQAEAKQASEVLQTEVHVIPNGIDDTPGPAAGERGDSKLVIGTAARINPQKRLEDLIEAYRIAMPELPTSILKIAGGVEEGCEAYAAGLKNLAKDLPVEWLGELGPNEMRAFLSELDIFAMISEPAGCPNASLEAMAAGLPVVATDVGGVSEQVSDGVTGRLIPGRDSAAFSQALVDLGLDSQRCRLMGAAGRERIEQHFSLSRMSESYWRVITGAEGA